MMDKQGSPGVSDKFLKPFYKLFCKQLSQAQFCQGEYFCYFLELYKTASVCGLRVHVLYILNILEIEL